MDFGKRNTLLRYDDNTTYDYRYSQDLQSVVVGFNYRFGDRGVTAQPLK